MFKNKYYDWFHKISILNRCFFFSIGFLFWICPEKFYLSKMYIFNAKLPIPGNKSSKAWEKLECTLSIPLPPYIKRCIHFLINLSFYLFYHFLVCHIAPVFWHQMIKSLPLCKLYEKLFSILTIFPVATCVGNL